MRVPKFAPGVTTHDRAAPGAGRRRRAAGARRAAVPARARTTGSARCVACDSATEALRTLHEREVDAVFLDIQMPGLTGLELAQVLKRFRTPPPIVFVTAHEAHAVDAFDLRAVDYVLKPVREERLAEAVRRVHRGRRPRARRRSEDVQIPVELGGVTRFVDRSRRDPRRGARRLRPAAHRRRQPPDPGAARPRSRRSGPAPASSASTARCWSRSATSPRCGWSPVAARSRSGRAARRPTWWSAGGTPASSATCSAGGT